MNPARLGAVLTIGFFTGMIAAIAVLVQGGGWILALAAYSGGGTVAVLATATLKALICRHVHGRAPEAVRA